MTRTNKQPRSHGEPIPEALCHIDTLIMQEFVVFLLDLGAPRRIIIDAFDWPTLLINAAFLWGLRRVLRKSLRLWNGRLGLKTGNRGWGQVVDG
jgi:hypothetical protein